MNKESLVFHRDFRRLWTGDAMSQFGTNVTAVALPLLAVTGLHATPFQVGLLTTFEQLAFLAIGLPAGAWVDRMRRRNVMVVADLVRAVALGTIPAAAVFGMLSLNQLYGVVLLTGCMTVFFDVSYQSYLPFLVGRDRLVEGNAKLEGTQSVAVLAGPGVGGLLVQLLTAPYTIILDAASYLWSALWIGAISHREPKPQHDTHAGLIHQIRKGLIFVLKNPMLRAIAGTTATSNLFTTAGQSMLIVLLARHLGLPAGVIGVLMSIGAVGGVLGAVTAGRLANRIGHGRIIWASLAVTSPLTLIQPFLQRDWTLGVFAAFQVVIFAGIVIYNVTQVSFRQQLCPEHLLGRMNATMRFFVWGAMPLGGLLGGILGDTIGIRPTLLVTGLGALTAFLWAYLSPLRSTRDLPTNPDQQAAT